MKSKPEGRRDLFDSAIFDSATNTIVVYRKDFATLQIPLAWFTTTPSGPIPNPFRIKVIDCGQTLVLGDYEAAADAIADAFDKI
jgi:hypothetical protein